MSDFSAILGLPYLMPNQAQKHVTANEWFEYLDKLVQLNVIAANLSEPPSDPQSGNRYIVPSNANGDFAGMSTAIAVYEPNGWQFVSPQEGWRAWDCESATLLIFDGTSWLPLPVELDTIEELSKLGINAQADSTNRLNLSSQASLFSHDGAVHQLKVNKSGGTDTASLLFQTGFSSRAEIGLLGDEKLSLKTSDDGSSWTTRLSFPNAELGLLMPLTQPRNFRP